MWFTIYRLAKKCKKYCFLVLEAGAGNACVLTDSRVALVSINNYEKEWTIIGKCLFHIYELTYTFTGMITVFNYFDV